MSAAAEAKPREARSDAVGAPRVAAMVAADTLRNQWHRTSERASRRD